MARFVKYGIVALAVFCALIVVVIYFGAHYPGAARLTDEEKELAMSVYDNLLDIDSVRMARNTIYSLGVSKTIGNTIHMREADYFSFETLKYQALLIHELAHVRQYQNGGWNYIPKSLTAQLFAFMRTGSRSAAYEWERDFKKGVAWGKLNPEQQAESIAEYFSYRERANVASIYEQDRREKLECFIPFLKDNACDL
jgi:hypothetical protein